MRPSWHTDVANEADRRMNRSASPSASVDVPDDWADAIDQILSGSLRRLTVLGPTDAGKSSFCNALLADAARWGRRLVLLDTDVDQKVVGPPACVTLGRWEGELKLSSLAFVGTTDPLRG